MRRNLGFTRTTHSLCACRDQGICLWDGAGSTRRGQATATWPPESIIRDLKSSKPGHRRHRRRHDIRESADFASGLEGWRANLRSSAAHMHSLYHKNKRLERSVSITTPWLSTIATFIGRAPVTSLWTALTVGSTKLMSKVDPACGSESGPSAREAFVSYVLKADFYSRCAFWPWIRSCMQASIGLKLQLKTFTAARWAAPNAVGPVTNPFPVIQTREKQLRSEVRCRLNSGPVHL
jgi:hypothetical protein